MKLLTAKALRPALSGAFILAATMSLAQSAATKPKLTLDVFFNSVSFPAIGTSPDGNSVIIQVERADWDQQIVRDDLWLYRRDAQHPETAGQLLQFTQSGHDTEPRWSPDGRWIAFLSGRKAPAEKSGDSDSDSEGDK